MKKIIYSLGGVVAIAAPLMAVISCGKDASSETPEYTSNLAEEKHDADTTAGKEAPAYTTAQGMISFNSNKPSFDALKKAVEDFYKTAAAKGSNFFIVKIRVTSTAENMQSFETDDGKITTTATTAVINDKFPKTAKDALKS